MERERDKIKFKVKAKKLSGIDRYLSVVLKVIGFLFIAVAGYYFIDDQGGELITKIYLYLTAGEVVIVATEQIFPWKAITYILLSHIIGLSILIWALYFSKRNAHKAYQIILSIIIAMTFSNTIIYFYWFLKLWASPYYNYYIASIFLVVTLTAFVISYLYFKKQSLLFAILIYFYVFIFTMLCDSLNENRYLYVLSAISIFNILLFLISRRDKPFLSVFTTWFFAYGFLMILVLKKFVYNNNETYLSLFFTISFIYFLIFYTISLYLRIREKKNIFLVFNGINTIIYIALNGYVLYIFGNLNYLILIFFVTSLVHILSIVGCNKFYSLKTNLTSIDTISLVLTATTFSLIFSDYFLTSFFGLISILLFFYAKFYKRRDFIKFCMISIVLLLLNYLHLIKYNYSLLLSSSTYSRPNIFQDLFINSLIVLLCVFLVRIIIKTSKQDGIQNWFNRRKYIFFSNIALTTTIFISIELLVFSLMNSTIYEIVFSNRIIFIIFGFFTLFIVKNDDSFSKDFKNWIYFPIYFFSIFFFLQIYFKFSFSSIKYVFTKNLVFAEIIIHYIELLLATTVLIISFAKLQSFNVRKYKGLTQFIFLTLCFVVTSIFCKEFDYVSILTSDLGSALFGIDEFQMVIKSNQILPYSLIILFCFSIVFIISFVIKNVLLRIFSVAFIGFDLIKIFFVEFSGVTNDNKGVVFIFIGFLLLLVSWFYNRTLQKSRQRVSNKNI